MKIYDLDCYDARNSFYGKAKVIEDPDNNRITLRSYATDVCMIEGGIFHKLWDGYSKTTMRHINSFLMEFNMPGGGKAWWNSLPVSNCA